MSDRDERIQRENDRALTILEERFLEPPDDEDIGDNQNDEDFDEPDEPDIDAEIDDYNDRHGTDY